MKERLTNQIILSYLISSVNDSETKTTIMRIIKDSLRI